MITIEEASNIPQVKVLLDIMRISNTDDYIHSISVANITRKMLEHSKNLFTDEEKDLIIIGALLHDIGKILVPLNLTHYPQSLSNVEYNIIKVHAPISYEIVKSVFPKTVQNICLYHHERPDGSGYIYKVNLSNIPLEALFVQVADIYDALVRTRPYKRGYPPEEALEQMKSEADRFLIDDQFLAILEKSLL